MGLIENTVTKACQQTAVYWGNPVNDGKGGLTYDDPVEISCNWLNKKELYMSTDMRELVSSSVVVVLQDLDEEGYLYLGTLDDFESGDDTDDPRSLEGAFIIKRFDKLPVLNSTNKYYRKAYL